MKRIAALALAVILLALSLTACSEKRPEPLSADDVSKVTATTSVYSSYMYVIEDRDAIGELVDMYNSLTYTELPLDEMKPSDLLSDTTLYCITYEVGGSYQNIDLSPKGYLMLGDFEHVCKLGSGFDENKLTDILETYNTFK